MNYGLIVAAGKGERFGGEKQFLPLAEKPVLYYAVKAFEDSSTVNEIILVAAGERIKYVHDDIVAKYNLMKVKQVVAGGARRQDSVFAGLQSLPDSGIVAIHDGVRPFVRKKLIADGFKACTVHPAIIFGVPIGDTVKKVVGETVQETIERSTLCGIQTPQFFELGLIKRAYLGASENNYTATDDASLVERLGQPVTVLPGDPLNIKITIRADLLLAEAILSKWSG